MTTKNADIGLVGLAVMGQNLALNIADHGYTIAVYNRDPKKMTNFIKECKANEPSAANVVGHADLASFVLSIKRPRKIVLLVNLAHQFHQKLAISYVVNAHLFCQDLAGE